MERTLTVEGMTCTGCEATITRALSKMDGVEAAHADHQASAVTITFDPAAVDTAKIRDRIEELGFTVPAQP